MKEFRKSIESLSDFIDFAKQQGYASGTEPFPLKDGGKQFEIHVTDPKKGNYCYFDTYYGFNPFYGREEVWFNGQKMWVMNYYGLSYCANPDAIFDFLKTALQHPERIKPIRGPLDFQNDKFSYAMEIKGDFDSFHGKEEIWADNIRPEYRLYFHGGKIA